MPIGSEMRYIIDGRNMIARLKRLYLSAFGTPDLHSHSRLKEIWRSLTRIKLDQPKVLDVGCGIGVLSIMIAKHIDASVVGIDLSEAAITSARKLAKGLPKITFNIASADKLAEIFNENTFDVVLLADVIEHIREDESVLAQVYSILKQGGYVIISVPTPHYPRFFGKKFHTNIGHVRDGYWKEDLERILERIGFSVIESRYYTRFPLALACAIFYRLPVSLKLKAFLSVLFRPVVWLDNLWFSDKWACSLLMIGKK
jgi:ubiquinone/menaquinone biosynthesis C-methylase UbiE